MYFKDYGSSSGDALAGFDMDGTLICTKSGKTFPTNATDWQLFCSSVPAGLQKLRKRGMRIAIFTNQKVCLVIVLADVLRRASALGRPRCLISKQRSMPSNRCECELLFEFLFRRLESRYWRAFSPRFARFSLD